MGDSQHPRGVDFLRSADGHLDRGERPAQERDGLIHRVDFPQKDVVLGESVEAPDLVLKAAAAFRQFMQFIEQLQTPFGISLEGVHRAHQRQSDGQAVPVPDFGQDLICPGKRIFALGAPSLSRQEDAGC